MRTVLAAMAAMSLAACGGGRLPQAEPVITSSRVVTTSTAARVTTTTAPVTTEPRRGYPTLPPGVTYPAAGWERVDALVDAFVAERGLNGAGLVVVDRGRGIVHEHYAGEFGPERVTFVASASKMISAGVLVRLAEQGLLVLDRPIAEYVPWAAGHNPGITVAQLLSNSSGLVGLDPTYAPYRCQFDPAADLDECAHTIFTTPDDDDLVVPPDTEFRYGGGQWQVAGGVAEAVSGRSWAELIDETYVEPCGLTTLGYNNHFAQYDEGWFTAPDWTYPPDFDGDTTQLMASDNPSIEAGAYIAPRDYARLLEIQLEDGRCGDHQVFNPLSVVATHLDRTFDVYGSDTHYGLGWWVDNWNRVSSNGGAYGAYPWIDFATGYAAYLVIEADNATGNEFGALLLPEVGAATVAARA